MRKSIFSTFFGDILTLFLIIAFFIAPLAPVFAQEATPDFVAPLPETVLPNTDTTSATTPTPSISDAQSNSTPAATNSNASENANENANLPEEVSPTISEEEPLVAQLSFGNQESQSRTIEIKVSG